MSHGDGTLAQYEDLVTFSDWRSYSYSNGVGDFDNDGDFDLILARGKNGGDILFLEKTDSGNQFVNRDIALRWSGAKYPAGMAVADFNEDGHLDFIITYYASTKCDLFTGDGNYGFTLSTLGVTAPSLSFGADAADFNKDGHADFVVAPYAGDFYINLGNGDGTFNTITHVNLDSMSYYGIAAADIDRDGNTDLIATSDSIIDIYYGNGDGTFVYGDRILDSGIYRSPVDNYDFNGDGYQDIVLGAYSNPSLYTESYTNGEGIAVMLGDGQGSFGDPVVYGGLSVGSYVTTISAPPSAANIEPVAVIYCDLFDTHTLRAIPQVTTGQQITLDGLGSYDEDGEIVSYAWDFGNGDIAQGDTVQHAYDEAGEYTITLTVTDNAGATNSAEVTLLVVPREKIAAKIKFLPRVLNLKSRGRWIWAFAKLPKGYQANKIAVNSLVINEGNAEHTINLADKKDAVLVRHYGRLARRGLFKLRIDRQLVTDALDGTSNKIVLGIQGQVWHKDEWVDFSATDTIRVIQPGKKRPRWPWWPDRGDDDGDDDDDDRRKCRYKYRGRHR